MLATGFLPGCQILDNIYKPKYTKLIEKLTDPDADVRRETVLALTKGRATKIKSTPKLLAVVALEDQDALVQATAVQALSHFTHWTKLVDVLAQTAGDESKEVRLATIGTFRSIEPDLKNMAILLTLLADDIDSEVKSETAEVLGAYPHRRALRGLIHAIATEEFRVSFLARQSLVQLTGQDFQYDNDAWQTWLAKTDKPLIVQELAQ